MFSPSCPPEREFQKQDTSAHITYTSTFFLIAHTIFPPVLLFSLMGDSKLSSFYVRITVDILDIHYTQDNTDF